MAIKRGIRTEYLDFVEGKFTECFSKKGYIEEQKVNITSKIDPTVDLIGSYISVLKKYITEGNIGSPGRFLVQECIKSKALKYSRTDVKKMFGSYYKCMGVLTEPKLEDSIFAMFDYLTSSEYLNIPFEDLRIRINSEDKDLINAIEKVGIKIKKEIDTMDKQHYKHEYGLDNYNITGRDFNVALRKKGTNEFINCGAFVVMETPQNKVGVDIGIGNCTLSMCKFGYNSTIESSRMADFINVDCVEKEKLLDSLIVVATFLKEDILNHSSKHFKGKFNRYYNTFRYWNKMFNLNNEEILDIILNYLNVEYNEDFSMNQDAWSKILKK